jgi:hypothetical protein
MPNSNGWGDGTANNTIGWGQGSINNTIGWGSAYAVSEAGLTDIIGAPAFDSDAQAFITATAITDTTQQNAIDALVIGLKTDLLWTKMLAVYPFVGGTATTCKYNLKNPLDTDAAFRLNFSRWLDFFKQWNTTKWNKHIRRHFFSTFNILDIK